MKYLNGVSSFTQPLLMSITKNTQNKNLIPAKVKQSHKTNTKVNHQELAKWGRTIKKLKTSAKT